MTIDREFRVSAPPELEISAPSATVTLDRGEPGSVTVHIETNTADDWTVTQAGNSIVVRDDRSGWRHRGGARVRITMPDAAAVRVTTASGDVTAGVATGRTQITTASGEIRIGIATSLTVKTASGDVSIDRVTADVSVKSASGDINAATVGGGLEASTASGDVRVDSVAGDVRVNTASGDVRVGRFEGASFSANTVSGDVTLGLPTGRSVDVDVKTLSGSVSLPEPRPASDVDGPLPNVVVRVKSVSGDFRLRRA